MGRIKAANGAFSEIYNKDVWALDSAEWTAEQAGYEPLEDGTRLPAADLLISKDVLQHLPIADVRYYTDIFRRNYRFSIIASGVFPDHDTNTEIAPGECRSLRLDLPPFDLRCAVLQRREYIEFGKPVTRDVCLMTGLPESAAAGGAIVRD